MERTVMKRSPAALAAVLTVLVMILFAGLSLLLQMLALNGASERQGATAMGISLACQSLVIIVLASLAARVTGFLVNRVNWNSVLAVAVTVFIAVMIGGTISFLSSIIAIPVAGIR